MNGEEKDEKLAATPVAIQEDGITFLSRRELEEYREQQMMLAWNDGVYA